MRIVYIDDFFHPDAGYHINLLSKYWSAFGNEVIIFTAEADKIPSSLKSFFDYSDITEKDSAFEKKNNVRIVRLPIIKVVSGRAIYTRKIFKKIKEANPDIVYCNGNDSLIGMQLTLRAKWASYGLVLDSHMLEIASVNKFRKSYHKFYRCLIAPIIIKEKIPVIRTQDDNYVQKYLGIPQELSPLISFGSDTMNFHPDSEVRRRFREKNGIKQDAFVVIYAGKLNEAKGVGLLKEVLKKRLGTKKEVVFLIVGTLDDSIEDAKHYFDDCENKIIRYPTQKYPELPQFYQASDIAIFPKQCSLSFFDVQACGLPVVFEKNPLNMVRATNNNALLFEPNDSNDFRNKILSYVEMNEERFNSIRNCAVQYIKNEFDYSDKAMEYIAILKSKLKNRCE